MCKGSRPCGGAGKAVHSGCVGAGGWEATRLLTRTPLPGPPFQQLTPGEEPRVSEAGVRGSLRRQKPILGTWHQKLHVEGWGCHAQTLDLCSVSTEGLRAFGAQA